MCAVCSDADNGTYAYIQSYAGVPEATLTISLVHVIDHPEQYRDTLHTVT
jgi:hypothetical protein